MTICRRWTTTICGEDDPTAHKAFDEATAILAGDGLLTYAFDVLADPATHPDAAIRAALVLALARAAGLGGMVGGQALDLAAETAGRPLAQDEILTLQAMKTGALLRFAVDAGAILGRADAAQARALSRYGSALGAAFQVADDILDAAGDTAALGKRAGKDAERGKATLVGLLGLDAARARRDSLVEEAIAALDETGLGAATETSQGGGALRRLAQQLIGQAMTDQPRHDRRERKSALLKPFRVIRARPRLLVCALLGVAIGLVLPEHMRAATRALIAWNVAVLSYLVAAAHLVARSDHESVRRRARFQDEGRLVILLLAIGTACASIGAIVVGAWPGQEHGGLAEGVASRADGPDRGRQLDVHASDLRFSLRA